MGIDLATWRARIGLYYYRICHPYRIKWRSSYGQLYKPGVTSWGVREVMPNDTPLILKGCMAVVALSLILEYVVHTLSKGRGGGGKVRCHWREATFQVRETVDGGMTLVLSSFMVVVLLLIAGDVELNPGPGGRYLCKYVSFLHAKILGRGRVQETLTFVSTCSGLHLYGGAKGGISLPFAGFCPLGIYI